MLLFATFSHDNNNGKLNTSLTEFIIIIKKHNSLICIIHIDLIKCILLVTRSGSAKHTEDNLSSFTSFFKYVYFIFAVNSVWLHISHLLIGLGDETDTESYLY